jgi:hypothetical protein
VAELLEDNNAKAGTRLGVGNEPDFVVTAVSGPVSVLSGGSFTASVTVCNQGTSSGSTDVDVYLSSDATISFAPGQPYDSDTFIGGVYVGWLEPGQCATQSMPAYANVSEEGAWYLGAIVDPRNHVAELLEDNNTKAGSRMGVGSRPDFIVTAVSGPASVSSGGSFTASVTVCNQGTYSGSTDVDVYLSSDSTISFVPGQPYNSDTFIGGMYVGWLEPGQCTTQPVQAYLNVSGEGAWYLGAIVDPRNYEWELLEDNNAKAGMRMGVGSRPDFIVTAVSGPASVSPGGSFTASVTVCNQGTYSGSTDVDVYLSTDSTISYVPGQPYNSDTFIGGVYVGWLEPGQCATQSMPAYANVSEEGAWYLGAIVDPRNYVAELLEDNNAKAGTRLGVGNEPDFVVTAVSGPASVSPGGSFTASVTVCNQGTYSGSTEVDVYLSTDSTISYVPGQPYNSDTFIGGVYVGWLEPGQCATQSMPAYANVSEEGAWYLGAIVDPRNHVAELLEDNNAKAGTRLGVGNEPDFVVTAVSGPVSVLSGGSFTASVTVCNQGTYSGSTEVDVYLSADATISFAPGQPYDSDTLIGGVYVGWLEPGQCATQSMPAYANVSEEGAWYLGAIVDPRNHVAELLEDNNAKAGTRMGVGFRPDFIVTAVSGPASVSSGGSFTASVTVCNQGTSADSADVDLFLSVDSTISYVPGQPYNSDTFIGGMYVGWLEPGQCTTQPVQAYPNVSGEGAWYLGAIVDPRNYEWELLEDNNAKAGMRMGVGSRPDFIATAVSGPASVSPGGSFTASVTVCNQGTYSGSTEVDVYLSSDSTISSVPGQPYNSDTFIGGVYVGWLEPGQCDTQSVSAYANVPSEGAWYLGALVDPRNYEVELLEDNNAKAGTRLGVGSRPDFVVTAVSGPASVSPGGSFTASVTVCNQGTSADSTEVEFFLSSDSTISSVPGQPYNSDTFIAGASSGWLEPGQCATQSVQAYPHVPGEGAWYLGAIADPRNYVAELLEDNNAKAGTRLGVGSRPDFVVTAVSGPASVLSGGSFTASVSVCNQGITADGADVDLFLSSDSTISSVPGQPYNSDTFIGGVYVGWLEPGQCVTQSVSAYANVPEEGAWYLGAIVDPRNYMVEFFEDNNAKAGTRMGVGFRPDFIVTAVSGPASVSPGGSFTASVTVCNQGTYADSAEVDLFLSADSTISYVPGQPYNSDTFIGGVYTGWLEPGQCTTQPVQAYANVPGEGSWYLGAITDPRNYAMEFLDDNNALAGNTLDVHY